MRSLFKLKQEISELVILMIFLMFSLGLVVVIPNILFSLRIEVVIRFKF